MQDFIADAKAKPGSITFGSVGVGSAVHINAEKFRLAAGIEATHVPYRGGAEVIADIIGGRIDFYFCPLATALPLVQAGQVRALLVSTSKRVADLPDVPIAGRGRPAQGRNGDLARRVLACEDAARHRSRKMHAAGQRVLDKPEMQQKLKKLGVEPTPMTPAEMDDLVKRDVAAYMEVIKAAGIKP